MSRLHFSCSHTKLKDVERASPCGRRATNRTQGEAKCMGHWVVDHLVRGIGGSEHARKTWVIASYLLLSLGVDRVLRATDLSRLTTGVLATLFSAGLLVAFLSQHPFGGLLCLITAPLIGMKFVNTGGGHGRYYLDSTHAVPEYSSRALELFVASVDLQVGLLFILASTGFAFLYWHHDEAWMRFSAAASRFLSVTICLSGILVAILSKGRYNGLLMWIAVIVVAVVVARGTRPFKTLATRFRI